MDLVDYLVHYISLPDVPVSLSKDMEKLKVFYANIDQFLNKKMT